MRILLHRSYRSVLHRHRIVCMLWLAALLAGTAVACGGGGGGGSALQPAPPGMQTSPTPTQTPSATPSPSPAACSAARRSATFLGLALQRAVARIPARVGRGPAARVCPSLVPGRMRCMAWIRTDIARPLISGPAGYAPADLQSAYNLTSAANTNGGGETVAVVDAYDDPKAESDLGAYRTTFALPACTTANGCFLKINESGSTSPLPGTDPSGGWEAEESLDLDMVSAACPNCDIVLLETASESGTDLYTAEDTAVMTCHANVISNSWNGSEYSSETSDESHFNHPGVMIAIASGDNGYMSTDAGFPSSSRYVTAVGGTSLSIVPSRSETVWGGTGSGCSRYIAQPSWQVSLGKAYSNVCSGRIEDDVAAVADPNTGVAVYDSFGGSKGCSAWCVFGGTSASTPIIAAVYALAGNGGSAISGSYSYAHTSALFDITSGSNGACSGTYLCNAITGFDGPTGNGTPNGIGAF